MYSIVYKEKVWNFHYKKFNGDRYGFYLINNTEKSPITLGTIFKMGTKSRRTWTAVSFHLSRGLTKVDGFKTKYDASVYLLRLLGFWE